MPMPNHLRGYTNISRKRALRPQSLTGQALHAALCLALAPTYSYPSSTTPFIRTLATLLRARPALRTTSAMARLLKLHTIRSYNTTTNTTNSPHTFSTPSRSSALATCTPFLSILLTYSPCQPCTHLPPAASSSNSSFPLHLQSLSPLLLSSRQLVTC